MFIILGLAFLAFVLFVVSNQITAYNCAVGDEYRFRYFALRDRLAMMVVKGHINENSWEYKHIIDALNFHINAVETMSLTRISAMLARYHMSSEEDRTVKMVQKRIENEEVRKLMFDFLGVTRNLLRRNNRAQIWLVQNFFSPVVRTNLSNMSESVIRPKRVIDKIDQRMDALSNSLSEHPVCA